MSQFMATMKGLLNGETLPINEENILPGVQEMMRTMGNSGWLNHKSRFLPTVVQDLVDRGYAFSEPAKDGSIDVRLTDKGKAYIARIGGAKARCTTVTYTAVTVKRDPPAPDEPA